MNVIRTISQLLAAFLDNTLRLITPQDGRNLIVSVFGAFLARDPTATDDNANTSGAGWFDTGSWWANTATQSVWRCWDGTATAAVWKEVAGTAVGNPPIGSVEYVKIDPSSRSGFPTFGSHTLSDGETLLAQYTVANANAGPWVVHSGAWTRPTWFTPGTTFTTDVIIEVLAGSENDGTSNAPAFYRVSPYVLNTPPAPWTIGVDALHTQQISIGSVECNGDGNIDVTPSGGQFTNPGAVFSFSLVNVPAGLISGTIPIGNIPSIPVSKLTGPGTISLTLIPEIPWSGIGPGTIPDSLLPGTGPGGGPYGDATHVGQFSLDSAGRVTSASDVLIGIDASQITSGTLSSARLPNVGPGGGPYGDDANVPSFSLDAEGRVTSVSVDLIAIDASQIVSGTISTSRLPMPIGAGSAGNASSTLVLTWNSNGCLTAVVVDAIAINASQITSGNLSTSRLPSSGLTQSVTLIATVTCSGGSLSTTTHSLSFTNGLLTGFSFVGHYLDGVLVKGAPGAPARIEDEWLSEGTFFKVGS